MKALKFTSLFLLTFLIKISNAQYWEPIAIKPGTVQATYADNQYFYAAYHTNPNEIEVARWDGSDWIKFPKITVYGNDSISKIIRYKSELYLAGCFDSVAGIENTKHLVKFDGTKWDSVGYKKHLPDLKFVFDKVRDMEVFDGKLFVCGGPMYYFDGNTWGKVIKDSYGCWIDDIDINNDTLFVCGMGTFAGWPGPFGFLDTLKLKLYIQHSTSFNHFIKIFFFQGELYTIYSNDYELAMIKFSNGKWDYDYYNRIENKCRSVAVYKNKCIVGLHVLDDDTLLPMKSIPIYSNVINIDSFQGMIIATGGLSMYNNQTPNIVAIDPFRNSGKLEGKVYHDVNKNCVFDANEKVIDKGLIEAGLHYLDIDDDGTFSYDFPDAIYTVNYINPGGKYKYLKPSPCNNYPRKVTITNSLADSTVDFALYEAQAIKDITTDIFSGLGWRARSGFTERFILTYSNIGTDTVLSANLRFEYDTNLVLISGPAPDSQEFSVLKYNIDTLLPKEEIVMYFTFKVPVSIPLNDTLMFFTSITTTENDSDLTNNYDTLIQYVVAAVDPNDKSSFPPKILAKNTKKIEYLIRFQNVGTDTAQQVVIIDTIDTEFLSLKNITIENISHPYEFEILGNTFIWTFEDIMLPDSNTDEPNSHGYIKYTANLKSSLKIGDSVLNRAYIYFDYQNVLPTNLSICYVPDPSVGIQDIADDQSGINIYPNPSNGKVFIQISEPREELTLNVYSLQGKMVYQALINDQYGELDLSGLHAGHYLLIIYNAEKIFAKRIITLTN